MATIKDVARQAKVSVSTVSRVINDSGYVGVDARSRVAEVMKALNYEPNTVARGLVSGKTATLGLIVPDVANPFFSDISRGVEDEAIANGYNVILCNTDWQVSREEMYIQLLRSKWVEGIVLVGSRAFEEELVNRMTDVPFVLVDRRPNTHAYAVWSNNQVGARIATEHLLALGCTRLVHICGPDDSPSAMARRGGFLNAVEATNVHATVVNGDFKFEGGYRAALEILQSSQRVDGIFAGNDMMAIAVIQAANELGIQIPNDLMLVGYDNISISSCVYPSLTTIAQPAYDMGRQASKLVLNQLERGADQDKQVEFKPDLIVRGSSRR